ncbi:MAG: NAD(P)H-dependent oxidoreductase [Idiomarina sp.]|nr:NAD(P)H-dependent oxidoreductase [Idiomarina sp.]
MSSETKKILVFAGSLRSASLNRKLAANVAQLAQQQGAQVTLLDLNEYPLPIYNGDIEDEGMPENVHKLQALFAEHDAIIISTPEYNGAVPALVKNTLDWISRKQANGDSGIKVLQGKVAGIVAASPGALGGLRALLALRDQLAKLSLWVAPTQFALGKASEAFDSQDELKDNQHKEKITQIINEVMRF